ncbi:MAG: cytosol nonspecific dipeptidase, partial [Bacteroidetes bacterium]
MQKITELNPKEVWAYFDEILTIPRISKKEDQIIAYLIGFAKKYKLKYKQDQVGNLLISKPSTDGMEDRKGVILQSHADM